MSSFSPVLESQKRQVSGLISSASTMVPSEVLPNSSLKSTRVTPHSARVFFRKSLTWKAYFLMVSISSQVASFRATAW